MHISKVSNTVCPPTLYHYRHQVFHHRIHHHIKYGGGERISFCHSTLSLKRCPIVSAGLCYHNHRLQYIWKSRRAKRPTLYPSKISRHLDLSKASYALCRSSNINYSTSFIKAANCWSSFASRVVVTVPRPPQYPWRTSWKLMEDMSWQFKIGPTTFHIASTIQLHGSPFSTW